MAKILGKTIHCLVAKPTAGGIRYYWTPTPLLRRNGWKTKPLGQDLTRAIQLAEFENEQVEKWRTGGARPKEVTKFIKRATISALIDAYKRSDEWKALAETTRSTYASALKIIDEWGEDVAAVHVTEKRVRVLRDALMRPNAKDVVQHHRAHTALRVGRTLFAWGKRNIEGITDNPFLAFDLATPASRDQIWDHEDTTAFCAAAIRNGDPTIGFAVELAEYIGQREGDLLKLQAGQYREVQNLDPELQRALAGEDGRAMGIFIKQGKTKRWVGVPAAGEMRRKIEMAIAANAKRTVPSTSILVSDRSGRPYATRWEFLREFNAAKARAIAPTAKDLEAGVVAHPALEDLQYRDLRRTCVVRLGELGLEDALIAAITGHKLGSVKKILEVYMPRTTKMAARAVVARIGQRRDDDEVKGKRA